MESLWTLVGLHPYEVVYEQGVVLVRPEKVWPPGKSLPKEVTPVGPFLRVPEGALSKHQDFLKGLRPETVVFADCLPFGSSKRFDHAVAQVFSRTPTVVLVHNTNLLSSLVKGFAGMRTLYLLHDLRVHVGARDPGMVHVGPLELRQLYGDCSALGVNHLVVDTEAACALAGVCPNLTELETNLEQMAALPSEILRVFDMRGSELRSWKSLVLGSSLSNADVPTSEEIVSMAAQRNPVLRHLQVYGASLSAIYAIVDFDEIASLSMRAESRSIWNMSFCYELLDKFSLTSLALKGFLGIDFSAIAARSARLRRLSVTSCHTSKRLVSKSSFPELDTLELDVLTDDELQSLLAACPKLVTLRLRGLAASRRFLSTFPGNLSLKRLEQLELACPESLADLGVSTARLETVFDSLPSLRYVAVESYALRLFLESRLPHVALGWLSCTVCAAKFPQHSKEQSSIWHKVHRK
ncbi:uncharacterized protein LOC8037518 [Ixodes scapularis]|uniref:uncharacterized protein LOC8037518 n=1 Tax=Ixodes scapularis TaxID=6945 RepID=UPI001A9E14A5|nr:uncharacterized protein LOC8037518 [Ixodes scapularis]